jgi:hypothetical protein
MERGEDSQDLEAEDEMPIPVMNSRKDVKSSPGQIILNISDNEGSL